METIEKWVKDNPKIKGDGSGYGHSDGDGYSDGSLTMFCRQKVYYIDGVPTVIHCVFGNFAKAGAIQSDFTEKPCYIAKGSGFFAHGETVKAAYTDLELKIAKKEPLESRIYRFMQKYPTINCVAKNQDLFVWHHILTGSCEFGRRKFAEEKNIDVINGSMSICDFIKITMYQFGGTAIALLKKQYEI